MFGSDNHCWQQKLFQVEHLPWDYGVVCPQEQQKIEALFQPISMAEIIAVAQVDHDEPGKMSS